MIAERPGPCPTGFRVVDVRRETVLFLSALLHAERRRRGTRRGRRALGCFTQAVLILRWFCDGTRIRQLAADHGIGGKTAYRCLHEGIDVLAAHAPDLHQALNAAQKAGLTHVTLDGIVIATDRVATPAPTVPTCGGPESTNTTAATSRSSPLPTAGPCGSPTYAPAANTT